ncbi:MAG: tRNA preQ1(34) S-adenosylmethionine ribosyltransferase-isomerase QueA [Betaproteobacteria bacterium]
MTRAYTLADFDYALPPELIAQTPPAERSGSRLLDVGADTDVDRQFIDLPSLLQPGDLVVGNDTRVIKARVRAHKPTGGNVEILLERIIATDEAWVQLRASHAPRPDTTLHLPGGATATMLDRDDRFHRVRFHGTGPLLDWLDAHGEIPLPPYIERGADTSDADRYQTVYARAPGAVAAPTAGLHFDDAMFATLAARGIERAFVTLHVGAGTFAPVQNDNLALHRMHTEYYSLAASTIAAVKAARARGNAVIAIGTTTLRALESAALRDTQLPPGPGETALFITPGFEFRVVDRLLTNFHLPRSTLLMLVSAFAGHERMRRAYAHAISSHYRFFSYGDAMLLSRTTPM